MDGHVLSEFGLLGKMFSYTIKSNMDFLFVKANCFDFLGEIQYKLHKNRNYFCLFH